MNWHFSSIWPVTTKEHALSWSLWGIWISNEDQALICPTLTNHFLVSGGELHHPSLWKHIYSGLCRAGLRGSGALNLWRIVFFPLKIAFPLLHVKLACEICSQFCKLMPSVQLRLFTAQGCCVSKRGSQQGCVSDITYFLSFKANMSKAAIYKLIKITM